MVHKPILLLLLLTLLSGCAKGSYKNPIVPPSTESSNKQYATVYFYTSSDWLGALKRLGNDFIVIVDDKDFKESYPASHLMIANRNHYSINYLAPGVHTFLISHLSGTEVARLEAGKDYYLAVKFTIAGAPYLRFLDREDFLNETKGEKQIRFTTDFEKGIISNKYEYEIVE